MTLTVKQLLPAARSACAIAACIVALASCGTDSSLIQDSTAPALVPTEARFLDTLQFDPAGAANNYRVRSNWSADFDPNVDTGLVIESFQINDPSHWNGDDAADDSASVTAFGAVLADSATNASNGPCAVVTEAPEVTECTYQGLDGKPFGILVRRFDSTAGQTAMIVFAGYDSSQEFITQNFNETPPNTAAENW